MMITIHSELHVHVITGKCVMILNLWEFDTLSVPPSCDLRLFLSIKDVNILEPKINFLSQIIFFPVVSKLSVAMTI